MGLNKKLFFIFLFSIAFLLWVFPVSSIITGNEGCIAFDHKECYLNKVYWYDSCGNPTSVAQFCSWNQECVDAQCVNKCGNGVCDSDETCATCSTDCGCPSNQRCYFGTCETYCGNGACDGSETCSSCYADCACESYERCSFGRCEGYCGNGRCDGDENCAGCSIDCGCASNEECVGGSCIKKCGNNIIDWGENCQNCPEDAGCGSDSHCFNGKCVECIKDSHCESRDSFYGKYICTSDFMATLERGTRTQGLCRNNQCSGEKLDITRPSESCGNKLCQDGHCGCNEGYDACLNSGKCEKVEVIEDGGKCNCAFQCNSNFCSKNNICLRAINTPISVQKSTISKGELTTVTISADNNLDVDVPAKLTLNIDSGASMSGVIGGDDCSGNQCTGVSIIPAKSRDSIEIDITGENAAEVKLTAIVTADIDGAEYQRKEYVVLSIIDPSDGRCTKGETSQNACMDCGCPGKQRFTYSKCKEDNRCHQTLRFWVYNVTAIVIIILVIILASYRRTINLYERFLREREIKRNLHEKEEKETAEKELKARKRIISALYKYKKKIDIDNAPSVEEVIRNLKLQDNEDIVHEEYLRLLDKMHSYRDQVKKVEKEKQPIVKRVIEKVVVKEKPVEKKPARQKFCTQCGSIIKENSKFCTTCGKKLKTA